jgi:hypothetical protein
MTTPSPATSTPASPFSPFLPGTSSVPEEQDRLKTFLVDKLSVYADVINDKKIGVIGQEVENFDGMKWFYKVTGVTRNGYQSLVYISSLPNTSVLTLTLTSSPGFPIQGIDPDFVISLIYGSASKPCSKIGAGDGDYFSFMAKGDSRISFTMSDTQIIITTTVDLSAYSGFIVVNYIRNGA